MVVGILINFFIYEYLFYLPINMYLYKTFHGVVEKQKYTNTLIETYYSKNLVYNINKKRTMIEHSKLTKTYYSPLHRVSGNIYNTFLRYITFI